MNVKRILRLRGARFRRGFSLIELLLAIFILGMGLISIAALFPAGIMLQKAAEDEFYGPVVAEHAMGVLRSRLDTDDFGTWWDCMQLQGQVLDNSGGDGQQLLSQVRSDLGADSANQLAAWLRLTDWPWLRPSLVVNPPPDAPDLQGAIDVFNSMGWASDGSTVGENTGDPDHNWRRFLSFDPTDMAQTRLGIPFDVMDNLVEGEIRPPRVLITANDRSWPPPDGSGARPRYYWDCAFRKIGDRVQGAIFVYRATAATLTAPAFRPGVTLPDASGAIVPAVPYRLQFEAGSSFEPWLPGQGTMEDPLDPTTSSNDINAVGHVWMHSGQWLMDQMGTVHRVSAGRDRNYSTDEVLLSASVPAPLVSAMLDRNDVDDDGDMQDVALFTASTALPPSTFYDLEREDYRHGVLRPHAQDWAPTPSVDHIFYIPSELPGPGGITYFIEPVFIAVEDL